MVDVQVIDDPAIATIALEPVRSRLLSLMGEPASAAMLATKLGIPRQKVTYHLRTLESHALVREAEQRQWGGLTERLYVASADSYIVSPVAMGAVAVDPAKSSDRLSAGYLIALAARIVREVSGLVRGANDARKAVPTLSIDAEIRFRSPADRATFTSELTDAITCLVSRYHDESAPAGRNHRLVVVAHPLPIDPSAKEPANARDA